MQVARGYAVMRTAASWWTRGLSAKLKTIRARDFRSETESSLPGMRYSGDYGDTQKSNVLENNDVEDVAIPASSRMFLCQCRSWSRQIRRSGEDWRAGVRTARHQHSAGILIKSALNTNIFGEPGWQGTAGVQVVICSVAISAGKPVPLQFERCVVFGLRSGRCDLGLVGFDDHRRNLGHTTASGAIKIRSQVTKAVPRVPSLHGTLIESRS